jgi:hypothetical protein
MIERTRIRVLEHIENERFELLPPEPYLRGYLLSYTQELGVPEFARLVIAYLARLPHAGHSLVALGHGSCSPRGDAARGHG